MKHLKRGLLATVIVALSGYGISKAIGDDPRLEALALANVEALAYNEGNQGSGNGGSRYTPRYRSGTVTYFEGFSAGFGVGWTPGGFGANINGSASFKSIICCLNATDIDGCDFSKEHSECGRRANRR